MKWVVLAIFLAMIPVLQTWLRNNPKQAPLLWSVLGFLPFVAQEWRMIIAPVSWAGYSGYVQGAEFSLIDVIAIAILLSRPTFRARLPFVGLWFVLAATTLLSAAQASLPVAALFGVWQILRVTIVFAAVASIALDERGPRALIQGMIVGICLNALVTIEQKLTGSRQTPGLFIHQNLLGMISHFVAFPALALALVSKRDWAMLLGVGGAMIVAVLGASRATIGLAGFGYVLLLALSMLRFPSGRKTTVAFIGLLALAAATPFAISNMQNRLGVSSLITTEDGEREAFKRTARMMLNDHPMGVGANQYIVVANTQGYSQRGGVAWNSGSRSTNVHNSYLLIGAETGYIGMFAFIALMTWPIIVGLKTAWSYRRDPRGEIALGFTVALIVVALHCLYEWIFVTYLVQVPFAMALGVIAGLARRRNLGTKRTRVTPEPNLASQQQLA